MHQLRAGFSRMSRANKESRGPAPQARTVHINARCNICQTSRIGDTMARAFGIWACPMESGFGSMSLAISVCSVCAQARLNQVQNVQTAYNLSDCGWLRYCKRCNANLSNQVEEHQLAKAIRKPRRYSLWQLRPSVTLTRWPAPCTAGSMSMGSNRISP